MPVLKSDPFLLGQALRSHSTVAFVPISALRHHRRRPSRQQFDHPGRVLDHASTTKGSIPPLTYAAAIASTAIASAIAASATTFTIAIACLIIVQS